MRTGQSKLSSLIEATTNTAIGFLVAFFSMKLAYWFLSISVSDEQNFSIVTFMTVISIARNYLVRRLFNWLKETNHGRRGT